jgi:acyl carrier protein
MNVASRTPEGLPSRCPLCGAETNLEFSDPAGDAPCPNCGCLIWRSTQLLERLRSLLSERLGVAAEDIEPGETFSELGADSLDTVELVMELEEEFDIHVPDEDAERIRTIADAIRYLEQRRKRGDLGEQK